MKITVAVCLALAAFVCVLVVACGPHFPDDPVLCSSDADCGGGESCVQKWEHTDGGMGTSDCVSTRKSCQKKCSTSADCSFCGTFGVCAVNICDQTGPSTCGVYCSIGK